MICKLKINFFSLANLFFRAIMHEIQNFGRSETGANHDKGRI